ncbi:M15 family metallopeptidase [Oerskovia sp. Root22]|uniref:M15 family metallopeptidase n=1 Tax=Oerskovia sp. Root22 TaxID=1736494 RepID=UPI0006F55A88|nr:M15 family metallopeptidase [Oerskovia sp. Root22]KRC37536.1 hypothetical protein ASE15_05325 [Oerskovia sp. Root22]
MVITYPNGSVPPELLAPLDGQPEAQLRLDAALSWNRARAAVIGRTGITLFVRGWNRTLAEQETFFFERYEPQTTGTGPYNDVRWYKNVRYVRVRGAAAAIPGTSNHGWGIAVDVDDYGLIGQFDYPRRTATFPILAEHGWTDTEGRGSIQEPWHLVYDPTRDQHVGEPAPTKGPFMALTDSEQARILEDVASIKAVLIEGSRIGGVHYSGVVQIGAAILQAAATTQKAVTAVQEAVTAAHQTGTATQKAVTTALDAIAAIPVKVWTTVNIWRAGKAVTVLQDLADTGTLVRTNQKGS